MLMIERSLKDSPCCRDGRDIERRNNDRGSRAVSGGGFSQKMVVHDRDYHPAYPGGRMHKSVPDDLLLWQGDKRPVRHRDGVAPP